MNRLIIKGGKKLRGVWPLAGNKNEALPLIAASLLFKKGIILKNLPLISDVKVMMEIAESLGVKIEKTKGGFLFTPLQKIKNELSEELAGKVRGSLLFLGPLLFLTGEVKIPQSGGDKIGVRKIDTHLEVFKTFGAEIKNNSIKLSRKHFNNKKTADIWLTEPSVTATENALILATVRHGKTIIKNAACEPHVVNLGRALEKGGAKINGLGTNLIQVQGVKNLKRIKHKISDDYMEMASALAISGIFGGKIKVKCGEIAYCQKIFEAYEKIGFKVICQGDYLSCRRFRSKTSGIQEISDGPWPSFPSDLMSSIIVLATQSSGQFLFHEKMFESRLYFTDQLRSLGAKLVLCDPHRVLVVGPSSLRGVHLTSPDIRAGMAMVIAALAARGTSIIDNAQQLDRGYENLVAKLIAIGADVKKEDE